MNDWLSDVIGRVHGSGRQMVLAITGGGSGAIAELLRVPGGSRSLLEAVVPYDIRALSQFVGFEPAHACSDNTAIAMARRARDRAIRLSTGNAIKIGIGATASLISDRPKHGDHRCHIATATDTGCSLVSIVLEKGPRDRAQEEELVSHAIVCCIAEGCDVESPGIGSLVSGGERWTRTAYPSSDRIGGLLGGQIDRLTAMPDGQLVSDAPIPRGVLAGSFNPLHEGHIRLARVAEEILASRVSFELSVVNVDKPPLDADTIRHRVAQFAWRASVELTRAPTFVEKAQLLRGATFIVGADTAARIVATKYYSNSESNMRDALQTIADSGCGILVAVRADSTGQIQSLDRLAIPSEFQHLFRQIPESRFRMDVSSSAIRAQSQRND